jgi:hypothetical protein
MACGRLGVMVWQRRAARTNFLIDQPVCSSIQRLTASAANTVVRCASLESLVRWQMGLACRPCFGMRKDFSIWKSWWQALMTWSRRFAVGRPTTAG